MKKKRKCFSKKAKEKEYILMKVQTEPKNTTKNDVDYKELKSQLLMSFSNALFHFGMACKIGEEMCKTYESLGEKYDKLGKTISLDI